MSKLISSTLEQVCLHEKGAIISGPFGSNISSKFFVESGIPVIRGNNLSLNYDKFFDNHFVFVTPEKADELNCYAYRNDLIFTAAGTIGQVGVIPENSRYTKYVISNKQIRARIDTKKIDLLYAYYWFSSPWIRAFLIRNNKGSTVPLLTLSEIKDLPIVFPESIDEQKAIISVIDNITKKIETNKKINDYLEEMAKTIYDYWFVQFDFPNENGKPYKSSGGKMVNANGHIIPEGWTFCKVQDIISNICTGLNPRDNFKLGTGDIKYITVKNLTTNGTLDFTGCDTIDESARTIVHNRSDIRIGDILFASIAPLGRCYLIQSEPTDWDINESVFSIRANTDIITPAFLYLYFMSDAFIKHATSSSTGSIFKGIRINTLLETELCVPPLSVILKFEERLASIFPLKSKNYEEIQRLSNLRDWLLPMLMNGQATIED